MVLLPFLAESVWDDGITEERKMIAIPKISADISVKALLERYPQLLQTFLDMGLICAGCPTEAFHTLKDVAREYRLDLNQLLKSLYEAIGDDDVPSDQFH